MAAQHRAHTTWEGDLNGSGVFTVGSGATGPQQVNWRAREEGAGGGTTSPEELVAAALASCFSMALSNQLAKAGTPPRKLETDAVATFGRTDAGFRITEIALTVRGDVDGDEQAFREAAERAKENCPVSQALKGNVELTVDAAKA